MKLTKLPDGTLQIEGTADEVRELLAQPKDAIGKMVPQVVPLPSGNCICGQAFWSVVPPWCSVHGRPLGTVIYGGMANAAAAAQPWCGVYISNAGARA